MPKFSHFRLFDIDNPRFNRYNSNQNKDIIVSVSLTDSKKIQEVYNEIIGCNSVIKSLGNTRGNWVIIDIIRLWRFTRDDQP